MIDVDGTLYFEASVLGAEGNAFNEQRAIFRVLANGVVEKFVDIPNSVASFRAVVYSQNNFFAISGGSGGELWRFDQRGFELLFKDASGDSRKAITSLTPFKGAVYFVASDPSYGRELYRVKDDRVELVSDINPLAGDAFEHAGFAADLRVVGQYLYFFAYDPVHGWAPWGFDGSQVMLLGDPDPSVDFFSVKKWDLAGDDLVFASKVNQSGDPEASEYWTPKGLSLERTSKLPGTQIGDWIYFSKHQFQTGLELWRRRLNGSDSSLLADINPGREGSVGVGFSSQPSNFVVLGESLLFTANDGKSGTQIWKWDGGQLVKISSFAWTDSFRYQNLDAPRDLYKAGSEIFFTTGYTDKIWKTDGNSIQQILGPLPLARDPVLGSLIRDLTVAGNTLYFTAFDGNQGRLWSVPLQGLATPGTISSSLPSHGNGAPFAVSLSPSASIDSLLSAVPQAIGLRVATAKDLSPSDGAIVQVTAPGWSDTIQLIRISKADAAGSRLQTRQPDSGFGTKVGSLIVGGDGNDVITGGFGWDIADGGAGNDLVKTGNGRDILTGGLGADELWGGFGWNTFRSEKDGSTDLLVIRSDQWLVNPRQNNTSGNNADGSKADVIEGLDSIDRITIQGVSTADIGVRAGATTPAGVTGIGIYAKGALEALYTGNDLTTTQLQAMVSGDNSQSAINNTIFAYGSGWMV